MYTDTLPERAAETDLREWASLQANKVTSRKVNALCDAFVRHLSASEDATGKHSQNIITAHVCKTPPDIEAALSVVTSTASSDPNDVEAAIEHICFLVDVDKLYDAALGLYNLDLALLVAQKSQKDPREYVPFLQNLRQQPIERMQFSIDDYLGRHSKALEHLAILGAFDELKLYTLKHSLYEAAIRMQQYREGNVRELTRLFADFLMRRTRFKDAAHAYESLGEYQFAMEAYQSAHSWREAFSCAKLVPLEESRMRSLATSIANSMIELKDHTAAAVITLDYLGDVEASARLFCQGNQFAEAMRTVTLHNRHGLLESVIDTSLVESQGATTETLADCRSQLHAQIPRIQELRVKKKRDPSMFYGAGIHDGIDIPDNVSLAPTEASTMSASLFTRYTDKSGTLASNATRKSTKGRRREERKRAMGKKGSVYEEEYLVNSLRRLVDRVNSINDDIQNLVRSLVRRGMHERARAVDSAMASLVELCTDSIRDVFGTESQSHSTDTPAATRSHTEDGRLPMELDAGMVKQHIPVLTPFARLSLLGG